MAMAQFLGSIDRFKITFYNAPIDHNIHVHLQQLLMLFWEKIYKLNGMKLQVYL